MTVYFLLFLAIGKLLIYLGMKFPPLAESKINFIKQLFSCDLCLGVWIFTGLSYVMGEQLFREFYFPVVSEVITGGISSFIVHLISIGWREKFSTIVLE